MLRAKDIKAHGLVDFIRVDELFRGVRCVEKRRRRRDVLIEAEGLRACVQVGVGAGQRELRRNSTVKDQRRQ